MATNIYLALMLLILLLILGPLPLLLAIFVNGMPIFGQVMQLVGIADGQFLISWFILFTIVVFATIFFKFSSFNISRERLKTFAMILNPWLLFIAYLWLRFLFSDPVFALSSYGFFKIFNFSLGIFVIFLLLVMFTMKTGFSTKHFEYGLFFIGLATSLLLILIVLDTGMEHRLVIFGGNPLAVARNILIGLIACLNILYFKKWAFLFIPIFLIAAFATGSRGPFIAALLTLYLMMMFRYKNKALFNVFFTVIVIAILLYNYDTIVMFLARGSDSFWHHPSIIARINLYDSALVAFQENPLFGVGIGNYQNYGQHRYPHNIILELLAETGFFGVILFFIALRPMKTFNLHYKFSPYAIFAFLALMFSQDITGLFLLVLSSILVLMQRKNLLIS